MPKVGGSLMRINRDTRFSRDKRPYKDHLDLWFWRGTGASRGRPGFWFRLTPEYLALGGGKHDFAKDELEAYRSAVVAPESGERLERALAAAREGGYEELAGVKYKRVPAPYSADHPRAGLLRHNGIYGAVELAVPPQLHGAELPALCLMHWRPVAPLVEWLDEVLPGV